MVKKEVKKVTLEFLADLIVEKFDSLSKRIDLLENHIGSLENKMASLEIGVDSMEKRVGRLEIEMKQGFEKAEENLNELAVVTGKSFQYVESELRLIKSMVLNSEY